MKKYNFAEGSPDPSEGEGDDRPPEKMSSRAKRLVIIGGLGIVLVGALYVYTNYFTESPPPPPPPLALRGRGSPAPPITPSVVKREGATPRVALTTPGPEEKKPEVKGPRAEVSSQKARPAEVPRESPQPPATRAQAGKPTPKPLAKVAKPRVEAEREYTIQVASLVRKRNALSLQERLEKLGYSSSIRKTTAPITRHRVYAGEFSNREEADRVARRLNVDGFPSNLVEIEPGKFRLEVGSSFRLNGAIDMAHSLQKKNYTPKIVSKATPTPVHQVRVGEYENRAEALKALQALKSHGFTPLIVRR